MKIIENFVIDNRVNPLIVEAGQDHLIIRNGTIDLYETDPASGSGLVGIDIRSCQLVEIINVKITAHNLQRKYAYGIRSGYSGTPSSYNTKVLISGCAVTGFGPLHAAYDLNRDCICSEGGDDLWIKDTILDGATDGGVDLKSSNLKMARCQIKNTYRLIREWKTAGIFSNCVFDTAGDHFWFYSSLSSATLFNPTFVQPMRTSFDQSAGVIQTVTVDPLIDPWFLSVSPEPSLDGQILFHLKELVKLLRS